MRFSRACPFDAFTDDSGLEVRCKYLLVGRKGPTLTNRGWGTRKVKSENPGLKPVAVCSPYVMALHFVQGKLEATTYKD